MTRPDVLVSGPEPAPRDRLPRWLVRGAAAVVVLGLLGLLVARLADDRQRRRAVLAAADEVQAVVRINESGVGAGGTVVVGVQVSGRGAAVRVDPPRLRPGAGLRATVIGAPTTVEAGTGTQIRMHLQPDCAQARALVRLDVDVPVTPGSGRQHVLRIPFPEGPGLVRRACGYLPVAEALTMSMQGATRIGERVRVHLTLRNDGREPITVTAVRVAGLEVDPVGRVDVPPGAPAFDVPLALRVRGCPAAAQVGTQATVEATDGAGRLTQLPLLLDDEVARVFRELVRQRCG